MGNMGLAGGDSLHRSILMAHAHSHPFPVVHNMRIWWGTLPLPALRTRISRVTCVMRRTIAHVPSLHVIMMSQVCQELLSVQAWTHPAGACPLCRGPMDQRGSQIH